MKSFFALFKAHPLLVMKKMFAFFLSLFIFFESGYAFTKNLANSRIKMIFLGCTVFLILIFYLTSIDYSNLINCFKKRTIPKPSFAFLFVCVSTLLLLLSFLTNPDKSTSLYGYIDAVCMVWCIGFFCKAIKTDFFIKIYPKFVFFLAIISLVFFVVVRISSITFATNVFFRNNYAISNYLYIYFDFGDSISPIAASASGRLMGPFWEPGVFGTHLLIAIYLDFVFNNSKRYYRLPFYLLALLLTKSLACYIIFFLVVFLWIIKNYDNFNRIKGWVILLIYIVLALIAGTVFAFVFKDKIFTVHSSLYTRLNSFYYYFRVFLKRPFLGYGSTLANQQYYLIAPDLIDASTSTMGFLLASFGLLGLLLVLLPIIGVFLSKRIPLIEKILLVVLYFLFFNKENQFTVYSIMFLYYLPVIKNLKFKWEKRQEVQFNNSVIGKIFFSNTTGTASNISWSFIVRIIGLIVGLVTVPIFDGYFGDNSNYGVWLTIISVLTWILQFDFGFSNGLRTQFSKAYKLKDWSLCKAYLKSTYKISIISGVVIALLGMVLAFSLPWNSIYNIDFQIINKQTLSITMMIVFLSVAFEFSLRPIRSTMDAVGKSAVSSSLNLISNILLLICASFLTFLNFSGNKFIILAIIYIICINIPLIISTIVLFRRELNNCIPSLKGKIDFAATKQLMGLNLVFFIIQIANLVLYGFNDILISNFFGPSFVTDYTKYYKIFSIIVTIYTSVFQAPIWVAVSKAAACGEVSKIKKLQKLTLVLSFIFTAIAVLVSAALPLIFNVWLGESAPYFSWIYVAVFLSDILIRIWLCAFTLIGNGLGAIKGQCIVYSIAALLKIPMIFLFMKLNIHSVLGYTIVVISNAIIMWVAILILPFELNKKLKTIERSFGT